MTYNSIPQKARTLSADALNRRLADAIYLARLAKHAHWNVTGSAFIGIHKLFDEVVDAADDWSDTMAERIRALGIVAKGRIEDVEKSTTIKAQECGAEDQKFYAELIAKSLAAFSGKVRSQIKTLEADDPGTANMLADISNSADKYTFLVESHLA